MLLEASKRFGFCGQIRSALLDVSRSGGRWRGRTEASELSMGHQLVTLRAGAGQNNAIKGR
jgi:hypothetical protein